MLKHSTDTLPPPPQANFADRAAPPTTNLSSHVDCLGVLLGLDIEGVLEIEDGFSLPSSETSVGCECEYDLSGS
jgi:translation initiation factor 3 subunit H